MKYLSVCSGIEAASVAWEPLGWEPLAFSEIEAFPRAVLKRRYPDVPLHGDFTLLRDQPWIVDADVLIGGTPCQSFSVAGLRGSLSDDRGNLTLEFVRLADAIDRLRSDAGRPPCWTVWENVPGVLSTADNAFGAFLGGLVGGDAAIQPPGGGWAGSGVVAGPKRVAAWRTLDAQHFGLAQRRKRIFVLALGGAGAWACADALLPIQEGGVGHPPTRGGKAEVVAPTVSTGTRGSGDFEVSGGLVPELANPLTARMYKGVNTTCDEGQTMITHTLRADGFDASEDGTGRGTPLVPVFSFKPGQSAAAGGTFVTEDYAPTLQAQNNGSTAVPAVMVPAFDTTQTTQGPVGAIGFNWQNGGGYGNANDGLAITEEGVGPLSRSQTPAVAFQQWPVPMMFDAKMGAKARSVAVEEDMAHTISTNGGRHAVAVTQQGYGIDYEHNAHGLDEPTGALLKGSPSGGGHPLPAVMVPVAFAENSRAEVRLEGGDGSRTGALNTGGGKAGQGVPMVALHPTQDPISSTDGTTHARGCGSSGGTASVAVAFQDSQSDTRTSEVFGTLDANYGPRRRIGALEGMAVRRITCEEAERLQGFPDHWTAIPWRGKPAEECPDGPRYKALGNSMAVPVIRYLGERIEAVRRICNSHLEAGDAPAG
jgi:DNA (cytosine-5)-methyltransferase 1